MRRGEPGGGRRRRPIRAGFFIDGLETGGGTENQLIFLLQRLDRKRVAPRLACLRARERSPRLPEDVVPAVLNIPEFRGTGLLSGLRRARAWIRRERLDVVLTFFRDANIVGTLGGRWAGIPVITTRRNMGFMHTPREFLLLRFLNRFAVLILANSEAVRERTIHREKAPPERVRVILNAVEADRFRPVDPGDRAALRARLGLPVDGLLVGCVANLRPVKGHLRLIEAFAAVQADLPRAGLVLVGEGPLQAALAREVEERGLREAVHFLGQRGDVPDLLPAFDLCALASESEGLSNALLEAMACGLPVVATAVGGNPELLEDGALGRLVPPGDPVALGRALRELLADPAERSRLGAAARVRVLERHDPERALEAWTRAIEESARVSEGA